MSRNKKVKYEIQKTRYFKKLNTEKVEVNTEKSVVQILERERSKKNKKDNYLRKHHYIVLLSLMKFEFMNFLE